MNEKDTIKAILEKSEVPERISPDSIQEMLETHAMPEKRSIVVRRNIIRAVSLAASLTLVIGLTGKLWSISQNADNKFSDSTTNSISEHDCTDEETLNISNMKYAESYEEIYEYLQIDERSEWVVYEKAEGAVDEGAMDGAGDYSVGGTEGGIVGEEGYSDSFSTNGIEGEIANGSDDYSALTTPEISENSYTETYNQEVGVNEADIVKTDGKNIYYCSYDSIQVAEVNNGEFVNSEVIAEDIGSIEEMYLYEDKLIAISSDYDDDKTLITVYSKDTYQQIGQYSQDGYFDDIRLMDNGYMYLISQYYNYNYIYEDIEPDETEKYIPSYVVNEEETLVGCEDILISECDGGVSYINLASFDISSDNPCQPIDIKSVVGNSGNIYCSQDNLYITYGWEDTEITRFSISSGKIVPQAGTRVKGYVNDQFSMSEYDGYFRIATTFNTVDIGSLITYGLSSTKTNNCIYVLDMSLEQVGYISGLGRDEIIQSVNFDGDKAYVVTFRQTDPLYSVDLSDPKNPVLMDELKITGYSSYMQKWDDGLLLGFGEAGNEEGDLYGFKLSMFDNSDPNNIEVIDTVEITSTDPDRFIYSQALNERKALLISPEHNIIGFPVSSDNWYTSTYKVEVAYVFYSFENGKFKELGSIDYTFGEQEYYDSYYYSSFDRAVIIGDYVYALSSEVFVSADINNFIQKDICRFSLEYDESVLYTYD